MNGAALAWALTPLVAAAGFGRLAPRLAGRMHPRPATKFMSVGALAVAAASVAVPALILVGAVGRLAPVAARGHWSTRWLNLADPWNGVAGVVVAAVLAGQAVSLLGVAARPGRRTVAAWRLARRSSGPLVVVADPAVDAFALPGWPGRIVATTGLLDGVDAACRRAVLAHEQAHLDAHHDLHLLAAGVAGAVNPLLRPLGPALHLSTERWADEAAAERAGGRRQVAEAIACVAAMKPARPAPAPGPPLRPRRALGLPVADADVLYRVGSLLGGPPPTRRAPGAALAALAVAALAAAAFGAWETKHLFEAAEHFYTTHPGR